MHQQAPSDELSKLLALYNLEIDRMKSRLLYGVTWEELQPIRKNIASLALAIHQLNKDGLSQKFLPAESSNNQPVLFPADHL